MNYKWEEVKPSYLCRMESVINRRLDQRRERKDTDRQPAKEHFVFSFLTLTEVTIGKKRQSH